MSWAKPIVGLLCGVFALAGCGSSAQSGGGPSTVTATVAAVGATPASDHVTRPRARPRTPDLPVAVTVSHTAYGPALVDRRGFALYLFTRDRSSASTCAGACATAWPPYIVRTPRIAAGSGASTHLLGSVRRRDGRLQVTYAGHPLYYYVGDRRPHQVLCQAVTEYGGTWYIVAENGQAIR